MENSPEPQKDRKKRSITILIVSLLLMVLLATLITQDMNQIKAFISKAGGWGIVISLVLYAIFGVTLLPSEPLTLFIGALFGPAIATLVAATGNTISAFIEYYMGTRIGSATSFIEKKEKLPFGIGKLKVDSFYFLVGGRIIPGYGPKLISIIAGIYRIPLWRYFWTAFIPNLLGSAIFAFGGFGIGALINFLKLP